MTTQQSGDHGEAAAATAGPESPLSPPLSPASAAAAALFNGRWNPTKEQVAVLEGMYEQGLRTPSAEQIQRITARLREHGPVEAKNVFYWFQNHKARHRQKQKQDTLAYFNRMFRRPPPLLPVFTIPPGQPHPLARLPASPPAMMTTTMALPGGAACNNGGGGTHQVMYRAPYYMPAPPPQASSSAANAAGYYTLQQAAAQHMAAMGRPRMESAAQVMNPPTSSMYQAAAAVPYATSNPRHAAVVPPAVDDGAAVVASAGHVDVGRSRETLELFPLRPTFMLPETALVVSTPSPTSASFSGESECLVVESSDPNAEALPFYDFLGLHQSASAGR